MNKSSRCGGPVAVYPFDDVAGVGFAIAVPVIERQREQGPVTRRPIPRSSEIAGRDAVTELIGMQYQVLDRERSIAVVRVESTGVGRWETETFDRSIERESSASQLTEALAIVEALAVAEISGSPASLKRRCLG